MTSHLQPREIAVAIISQASYRQLAHRLVGPNDVDEALQRTAEIALGRRPMCATEVEAYYSTVLRHECYGIYRRNRRQAALDIGGSGPHSIEEPDDPRQDPAAICEHRDELAKVAEIKPVERQALSDLAAGLSYSEIQEKHGWTYRKVSRCLSEGRERLRALEAVC